MYIDGFGFFMIVEGEHILGDSHYFIALVPEKSEIKSGVVITVDNKRYKVVTTSDDAIYASKNFSIIHNIFANLHEHVSVAIVIIPTLSKNFFIIAEEN